MLTIGCNAQVLKQIEAKVTTMPQKNYSTLNELYSDLVSPIYNKEMIVWAFAYWIVNNIEYDVNYKHSSSTLETVQRKKGVCQDYAELFRDLCSLASIDCNVTTGAARNHTNDIGLNINSNHAWNVVSFNGKSHLFDLTWAAGHVNEGVFHKKYRGRYMDANPKTFVLDHYPEDPVWQLLPQPVQKKDFDNSPFIYDSYFDLNIKNHIPKAGVVFTNNFQLRFQSDSEITDCILFKWPLNTYGSTEGIPLSVKKSGNEYTVNCTIENPGAYRCEFSFNHQIVITYKIIPPSYKPKKPTNWDTGNPHRLIEAYTYAFYAMDYGLFRQLNPQTQVASLNSINNAKELNLSLTKWFGDFDNFYRYNNQNEIFIPVNNFEIVLQKSGNNYLFKQIIKK